MDAAVRDNHRQRHETKLDTEYKPRDKAVLGIGCSSVRLSSHKDLVLKSQIESAGSKHQSTSNHNQRDVLSLVRGQQSEGTHHHARQDPCRNCPNVLLCEVLTVKNWPCCSKQVADGVDLPVEVTLNKSL
jgi:hypothetical protein